MQPSAYAYPNTPTIRFAPWYHQKWFVVLMLLLVFPVGLILLWTSPVTRTAGRIVWTILIALTALGLVTSPPDNEPTSTSAPRSENQSETTSIDTIKASATTPRYDDLARNPSEFKGRPVVLKGEVIQTAGSTSRPVLRVNVTENTYFWTDTIWVNAPSGTRVLEKDIIQIWGTVRGEREYTALLGNSVRLPEIDGRAIEVLVKAGDRKQ